VCIAGCATSRYSKQVINRGGGIPNRSLPARLSFFLLLFLTPSAAKFMSWSSCKIAFHPDHKSSLTEKKITTWTSFLFSSLRFLFFRIASRSFSCSDFFPDSLPPGGGGFAWPPSVCYETSKRDNCPRRSFVKLVEVPCALHCFSSNAPSAMRNLFDGRGKDDSERLHWPVPYIFFPF